MLSLASPAAIKAAVGPLGRQTRPSMPWPGAVTGVIDLQFVNSGFRSEKPRFGFEGRAFPAGNTGQ